MEIALILLLAFTLSGGINPPGVADYSVKPISVDGEIVCCEVKLYNSKDIGGLELEFEKTDGNYKIKLKERAVDSSTPSAARGEANAAVINGVAPLVKGVVK